MTQARDAKPVLEFEGRKMTLTVLRLLDSSLEALGRELDRRIQEAPAHFRYLPLVLDVDAVAGSDLYLDLPGFAALLRTRGLVPLGIRGGDERWTEAAGAAGLLVYEADSQLAPGTEDAYSRESSVATETATATATMTAAATAMQTAAASTAVAPVVDAAACGGLVVTEPVRSGQQCYARGGDLVILAPVSFGAEVSADGHIHVYHTLQGRALAGMRGDKAARIFCRSFRADFVSIAGIYGVSEQFDDALRGQPVQVSLQGDALRIERL